MAPKDFIAEFTKLSGPMPIWHGTVNEAKFHSLCEQVRHDGGKLVALCGSDEQTRGASYALHVSLVTATGMLCLALPISAARPAYPDISDFPGLRHAGILDRRARGWSPVRRLWRTHARDPRQGSWMPQVRAPTHSPAHRPAVCRPGPL